MNFVCVEVLPLKRYIKVVNLTWYLFSAIFSNFGSRQEKQNGTSCSNINLTKVYKLMNEIH